MPQRGVEPLWIAPHGPEPCASASSATAAVNKYYTICVLKNLKTKNLLVLLLIFFFIKGLILIFLIPPWQAPDEPGHVAYVMYLYNEKKLPSISRPFISKSIINSVKLKSKPKFTSFNRSSKDYILTANLAAHPPLYYLFLLPFYIASLNFYSLYSVIFLRIGSLILGTLAILLTYLISLKIFNNSGKKSLFIALLLSFQPMFSFISSIVNSDILTVVFFLAFILSVLKSKTRLLILITAFSILVKPQLVILIPLFFIYLLKKEKKFNLKQTISLVFLTVIPSLFWFIYRFMLEGYKFFYYPIQDSISKHIYFWNYPINFLLSKQPIGIFMSFTGFFGWLDVPLFKWCYVLLAMTMLIPFYKFRKYFKYRDNKIRFLEISLLLYVLTIFVYDFYYYSFSQKFSIQGRYLSPILPIFLIILIKNTDHYPKKIARLLSIFYIMSYIIVQFVMFAIIKLAYHG